MKYLAVLGRQPEFGLAELESIVGADHMLPFGANALLDTLPLLPDLGGTIKLAQVVDRVSAKSLDDLAIDWGAIAGAGDGSFDFGISVYGLRVTAGRITALGLTAKKLLKASGRSVRFVAPKDGATAMTAAQLKYNHIPGRGFEIIIAAHGGEIITAVTAAVQDIDAYTERDQARPGRDARVGMLPPKLAQILVNLASATHIYDPFCGSGVVLQEALLMAKPAGGSDIDPAMVKAAQSNLDWLAEQTPTPLPRFSVTLADAKHVKFPTGVAIASEGYLGPALSATPTPGELAKMQGDLRHLVAKSLANFAPQLASGARVVLCLPAWRVQNRFITPEVVDQIAELGYNQVQFVHAKSPLVYHRDGQFVGRALLILRKN